MTVYKALATFSKSSWFLVSCWLLVACQDIPANNPFDPTSPEVTQASGQVMGELLTSEAGGDLEGALVYLSGRSGNALVECLERDSELDGYCSRAQFTFSDVPPGEYQISLSLPCYSAEPIAFISVGIGETVDLTEPLFEPGGAVEGSDETDERRALIVRYARGVVSGAVSGPSARDLTRVRITDGRGALTTPDDQGRFRLEMAACQGQIKASLDGFMSADSSLLEVPVGDELRLEEPLVLELEPIPAMMVGNVEIIDGEFPTEGLTLTLVSASSELGGMTITEMMVGEEISLEGLPTGPWDLTLSHPSFQPFERRVELRAATRGIEDAYQLGVIRLSPAIGTLKGRVSLERPRPNTTIYVELIDGPSEGLQVQANTEGEFSFTPVRGGEYRVSARADGFLTAETEQSAIVLNEEVAALEDLTLNVNPSVVRGAVQRPSILEGVVLSITLGGEVVQSQDDRPCELEVDCLPEAICEGEGAGQSCLQPSGFFQFDRVLSGEYTLTVRAVDDPRARPVTLTNVRAIAGEVNIIEGLELERSLGQLSGTIRLADLTEELAAGSSGLRLVNTRVITEEEGTFSLIIDPLTGETMGDSIPVGAHLLSVSHPDYLLNELEISIDHDGAQVDFGIIDLEVNPSSVSGSVVDDALAPIAGASVLIGDELTLTDVDGRFTLGGLRAGQYLLSVTADGFKPLLIEEVNLLAGMERTLSAVSLAFATGSLEGSVTLEDREDHSGVLVRARHAFSGEEQLTLTDETGTWRMDELRTGEYMVTASFADYQPVESILSVEEEGRLNLNFELLINRACLRGQINLSDGATDFEEVNLTLLETVAITQGDESGQFQFDDLAPGAYTILAQREGYENASGIISLAPGEGCESAHLTLILEDRQAPAKPTLSQPTGEEYIPLAGGESTPLVIAAEWNSIGRTAVNFILDDNESPLTDRNFDPSQGLGEWRLSIDGDPFMSIPERVNGERQLLAYEQDGDQVRFIIQLPVFNELFDEPLAHSAFIQSLLGQEEEVLSQLGEAVMITQVDMALGETNSLIRYNTLSPIALRDFRLVINAIDDDGNRSEPTVISLRLDYNPPILDPLLIPEECQETDSVSNIRACQTDRETLVFSLRGNTPEVVCAYLIELGTDALNSLDFTQVYDSSLEDLFDVSLVDECLSPSASHLISSNDEAEGERVYCLFGVDAAGRVALSTQGRAKDFCLAITRDVTAPDSFTIYPHRSVVRGSRAPLVIIPAEDDPSLAYYEMRNLTTGTEYTRINLQENHTFLSAKLRLGSVNHLQLRAVDLAGNTSEPVAVEIVEDSVRELVLANSNQAVTSFSVSGDQTILVSPSDCIVDGNEEGSDLGGRGCRASISLKDGAAEPEEFHSVSLTHRYVFQESHSFSISSNAPTPLVMKVSATGKLDRFRLRAQLSASDPRDVTIQLMFPNQRSIDLNDFVPIDSLFQMISPNTWRISVDSEDYVELSEEIQEISTHGNWRMNIVHNETSLELSQLDLKLAVEEGPMNRCIIACGEGADSHTGRGSRDFQVALSETGLLWTQYTEHASSKSHYAHLRWFGGDGILGTEDDVELILDDESASPPTPPSQPVIAIANSREYSVFARAGKEVDPVTGEAQDPHFTLHSFYGPSAVISQTESTNQLTAINGSAVSKALVSHQMTNASLKSMTLTGQNVWFIYTDLSVSPSVDKLGLWILEQEQSLLYEEVELSSPYNLLTPLSISEDNNRLLIEMGGEEDHVLVQVPAVQFLIKTLVNSGGSGSCICDAEENQICIDRHCQRLSSGIEVRLGCGQISSHPCSLCVAGENRSISASEGRVVLQQSLNEGGEAHYNLSLLSLNEDSCDQAIPTLISSDNPFSEVSFNSEQVTFIGQEGAVPTAFELEISELSLGSLGVEAQREDLIVGHSVFLERRVAEGSSSLFLTRRTFGSESIPLSLPDRVLFNPQGLVEVEPDPSWLEGRGFAVARRLGPDYIYVAMKSKTSSERVVIRAEVDSNAETLIDDWVKVVELPGELYDLQTLNKGSQVLVMIGAEAGGESGNGPLFLFDLGEAIVPWTYGSVGVSNVPSGPCKRVAVQRLSQLSIHFYLFGCVTQMPNSSVSLHFGEMNKVSFTTRPSVDHLSVGQNQYLNQYLESAFTNENIPTAYKVSSVQINSAGSVLLELRDDEVRRLYYSERNDQRQMFEAPAYSIFRQLYARLGEDNSPPIFGVDSLVFSDELITQEPEIVKLSLFDQIVSRLSLDESPQYSPTTDGESFYWFDERYLDSDDSSIGVGITAYELID